MIRNIILVLLATACILLATWQTRMLLNQMQRPSSGPDVETALVTQGEFIVGPAREGPLESSDLTAIRAPQIDTSILWIVEDGAKVKKGDLIARLDTSRAQMELDGARMAAQTAKTQIEQTRRDRQRDLEESKLGVDRAERSVEVLGKELSTETEQKEAQLGLDKWTLSYTEAEDEQQQRLFQAGLVTSLKVEQSGRDLKQKKYALEKSEKALAQTEAEHVLKKRQQGADIETARFNAQLAQENITKSMKAVQEKATMSSKALADLEERFAKSELYAPKDGIVTVSMQWDMSGRRPLRSGDQIWGEMEIASITDFTKLQVNLSVEESAASKLKVGQEAIITILGIDKREFKGKIATINPVAYRASSWEDSDAAPGQRVFGMKIKMDNPDTTLIHPGMKARVRLVLKRIPKVISIPVDALFEKPGVGEVVYIQKRDGSFEMRKVVTGERNDEAVVIRQGVRRGERVALSDPTKAESS
jgi:HlyD family secretion protein